MNMETTNSGDRPNRLHKTTPVRFQLVAGALVCVLFPRSWAGVSMRYGKWTIPR